MELEDFTILREDLCCIRLKNPKGAKLRGRPETVMLRDTILPPWISSLRKVHSEDYKLFKGSYRDLRAKYLAAAAFLGLVHPPITPHGIRRGGATRHFLLHKSFDAIQAHGR